MGLHSSRPRPDRQHTAESGSFTWPTHCESSADVHRCDLDEPGEADSGCSTLEVSASAFAGQAVVVGVQARLARSTVSREAARCDLSLAITTPDRDKRTIAGNSTYSRELDAMREE